MKEWKCCGQVLWSALLSAHLWRAWHFYSCFLVLWNCRWSFTNTLYLSFVKQVYVSYDYGTTFTHISDKFQLSADREGKKQVISQFYHSPADNKRVSVEERSFLYKTSHLPCDLPPLQSLIHTHKLRKKYKLSVWLLPFAGEMLQGEKAHGSWSVQL